MLAKRYAKLPSEIIDHATTFDLQVFDLAVSFEAYKSRQASGAVPEISEDAMLEEIRKRRAESEG